MTINLTFLKDGTDGQAQKIANQLAEFVNAAESSIYIAIYDFRLHQAALSTPVIAALKDKANSGVDVKIAFYAGKPTSTKGETVMNMELFLATGGDPAPDGTEQFLTQMLQDSKVQTQGIVGSKLMHSKYIVRDHAAVWTGSTNFTDDAWNYQENNIVRIDSSELASFYEQDFQELWSTGNIKSTGIKDYGTVNADETTIDIAFSPGEGKRIDEQIAELIGSAKSRIKVASMLLTSQTILAALDAAIRQQQVGEFGGIYDQTEMHQVVKIWEKSSKDADIIQTFQDVAARLTSKRSHAYTPTGKHDFMHNKVVVCDDAVVTGSFNFSHSATQNSENMIVLHSKELADQYSTYIDEITAKYGGKSK